jgi:hypothetical protein
MGKSSPISPHKFAFDLPHLPRQWPRDLPHLPLLDSEFDLLSHAAL